jgi:hypothetical protein
MNVDMCTHLVQAGTTDTPMTLVHTDTATAFVCPQCTADYCITLLDAGTPAAHVLETISLSHCDHGQDTCKRCLESLKDELSKRWMRYRIASDKPASNRLGRLRTAIRKRYGTEAKPLPPYPGLRRTGIGLDAAKAGQRWHSIRAQRLTALVPPVESIVVIPA